jgi:Ni/Co efflux regulator RcnB
MKTLVLFAATAGLLAAPMVASAQTPAQRQAMAERRQVARWDRGNPNWWRGRPEFRGYVGARPGAWFIPGRGYINVGPAWYSYSWRAGVIVPRRFWGYVVPNPGFYGLAPPPPGFAYIFLGPNIALINLANGRIVSVVTNIY